MKSFIRKLITFLVVKKTLKVISDSERCTEVEVKCVLRWYSPIAWILSLVILAVSLWDGGLRKGFLELRQEFYSPWYEHCTKLWEIPPSKLRKWIFLQLAI